MSSITPHYYTPYESGEDTDDKTGSDNSSDYSDSDSIPESEDPRIRREEDPRYAIISAAGPNFNTSEEQLKYMEHAPGLGSSRYDVDTNITSLSSFTYLNPPKTTKTTLFSVKSINRDLKTHPSPFNFQIKTPRVYKDVTKFQLVQISFPNNTATFIGSKYFQDQLIEALLLAGIKPECLSTCLNLAGCTPNTNSIAAMEIGRVSDGGPFMITFNLPSGSHTNENIANLLNANYVNAPPLNLISYNDFKTEFKIHRDISILFNEPGMYGSKQDFMNKYYSQQYINSLSNITDTVALNAYYYPILKELFATNMARFFISCVPYTYEQVYDAVLTRFLGLENDIYYNVCLNNQGTLDAYRKKLTFEHNPINKYTWQYNSDFKQFSVIHNSLHPSIQNDISNKYNSYYAHELSLHNLTPKSFQTLKTLYSNSNSVYTDLVSNISTIMANYLHGDNYSFTGNEHITSLSTFTAESLHQDCDFTSCFNYSSIFGKQFHYNFNGERFNFTNFLDYHSTMSSYYNTIVNTSSIISSIYGNTSLNHHIYVSTKYSEVMPYSMIQNKSYNNSQGVPMAFIGNKLSYSNGQRVTDPLLVEKTLAEVGPGVNISLNIDNCQSTCCAVIENIVRTWYGCLPVNTVVNNGINSLEYRLGLINTNLVSININSTFLNITPTGSYNILLQINPEQSFNNLDISMNENYTISNETTGQVQLMYAKILMQGVGTGEISETAIQNPILFQNPLGKVDKLSFKMYVDDAAITPLWLYYPFDIGINEWNATFQIVEEIAFASRDAGFSGRIPTIPIPNNPDAIQYMALTEKK